MNGHNFAPHHQRTAANQIYQSIQPGGCSGGSLDPFFSSRRQNTRSAEEIEALATTLLTNTNNLSDPAQVNQFLANLLNQLAHNKISRKNAIAMAYISQLLLNSISVKHKQDRDAQAAQQAAQANKPTQIVIDMPRPNYDRSPDLRSGESSDSHSVDVPLVTPVPNHAPKNPPPPPDDPPPSTHPQHTPLPRWGEQHFHNGTLSEPARPNTYGPPRMYARRTQRYANFKVRHNESTGLKSHRDCSAASIGIRGTANPGCERLTHRRDSAMVALVRLGSTGTLACARLTHRCDFALGRPRTKPGPFVRCRPAAPAFSLHLSCFA